MDELRATFERHGIAADTLVTIARPQSHPYHRLSVAPEALPETWAVLRDIVGETGPR